MSIGNDNATEPEKKPGVPLRWIPIQGSKNVKSVSYDIETGTFYVRFFNGTYSYFDVGKAVACEVVFAGSVGATVATLLKAGGYKYKRLADDGEDDSP